jgi:hypothetical protein
VGGYLINPLLEPMLLAYGPMETACGEERCVCEWDRIDDWLQTASLLAAIAYVSGEDEEIQGEPHRDPTPKKEILFVLCGAHQYR